MAWLCLAFYLASSVAVVYYFLDIADQYALFSLEHSKLHHSTDSNVPSWQFWQHIGDIPFSILVILLAVPYFQIFATLFYCTLPTANKNVNKCLIPVIGWIYLFQKVFSVFKSHESIKLDSRPDSHHIVSVSWLLTWLNFSASWLPFWFLVFERYCIHSFLKSLGMHNTPYCKYSFHMLPVKSWDFRVRDCTIVHFTLLSLFNWQLWKS